MSVGGGGGGVDGVCVWGTSGDGSVWWLWVCELR
jgi:hypothetical protein